MSAQCPPRVRDGLARFETVRSAGCQEVREVFCRCSQRAGSHTKKDFTLDRGDVRWVSVGVRRVSAEFLGVCGRFVRKSVGCP